MIDTVLTSTRPIAKNIYSPQARGLVAWYPMQGQSMNDTILIDYSGYGRNGTIVNATWSVDPVHGKCLQFDGSSAYVDLGNWNVTTGEITMVAWAYLGSGYSGDPRLIAKASGTSENQHTWMMGEAGTLQQRARIEWTSGTVRTLASGANAFNTNEWYHWIASYDGLDIRLYLNGTLTTSVDRGGSQQESADEISIGRSPAGSPNYWEGFVTDVRIYDVGWRDHEAYHAWNPSERYDLYASAPTPVFPAAGAAPAGRTTRNTDTNPLGIHTGMAWRINQP